MATPPDKLLMLAQAVPAPVGAAWALWVALLTLPLPWILRRWLLCRLCRYDIAADARIGWSLVCVPQLRMASGARIGHGNLIKGARVDLAESASIGDFNWISGLTLTDARHFRGESERDPALLLGRHAAVTSRHYVDCCNRVTLGEFSTLAGARSQILTHAIDLRRNVQVSAPVRIGRYCFVGTASVILKGAALPDFSVLAANSSLARGFEDSYTLYSGVPATAVKSLERDWAYFSRERGYVD